MDPDRRIERGELKTTRLPLFYGNDKDEVTPRDFVERLEAYCRATNKPENGACNEMYLALRGSAITWWNSMRISGKDMATWSVVRNEFLKDYDYRITGESAFKLLTLKQKLNESIVDYYARTALAIEDSSRGLDEPEDEDEIAVQKQAVRHFHRYMFISGLREDLRSEVLRHDVRTLDDAKEQARRAEFLRNQNQLKPAAISAIFVDELSALLDQVMSLDARDEDEEELRDEEIAAINAYRGKKGRKPYRGGPRRRVAAQSNSNSTIKCFNCDKMGHMARNCRAPKRENQIRAIQEDEEKPLLKLSPLNW